MASSSHSYPKLLSWPRLTTLFAALFVSLASGTNYVYSAWAPQLAARLNITHTKLNLIGLAGNVGVYLSGPMWGRIVDSRGPRILLASAFVLLLIGYSGIRRFYDLGLSPSEATLPTTSFLTLVICSFFTGAGGNGGLTSSVNSTAKTFPDRARASTTGLVISGFGLSAFLFSSLAHFAYPGDTSEFLLLLSLGTSFPMIVGFFLVRPIPLPSTESHGLEHGGIDGDAAAIDATASVFQHGNDSQTRLLSQEEIEDRSASAQPSTHYNDDTLELTRSLSSEGGHHRSRSSIFRHSTPSSHKVIDDMPNIHGRKLWKNRDFWLLFSILSMLSGTGLMYINNVGSMSQALYAKGTPVYDEVKAAKWQATQVSTISITNFAGRIFIGVVSDFTKSRLMLPRSYCLVLVSTILVVSQIVAANVSDIIYLWVASAVLGLGYGSVFSLFPTVCIEWFGLPHFSENWGYLSMSPMFGGNLFSVAFGWNLDAHEPPAAATTLPRTFAARQCMQGKECYVATLRLTTAACTLCVFLSIWAGWRDRQKMLAKMTARRRSVEVVWESNED